MSRRLWLILIVLMSAEIVAGFESSMILAGLPAWLRIYGDPVSIGWIVSSYLLVSAAAAALCGRLGDLFGRKKVLMVVIGAACVGSIISGATGKLEWVITGRLIQGLAGSIIPLCYGLAREHLPRERVGFAIGLMISTMSAASGLGFLLGGVLTDLYGPQSIFAGSAIMAAIVLVGIAVGLPRSKPLPQTGPTDWLGGILFVPAIAALLLVISNGARWGWTSPAVLGLGLGGVATLAIWVWHERRLDDPMIDIRLLANRNSAMASLAMAFAAMGVIQITQLTSLLLQQPKWTLVGLGTSATLVGLMKGPSLLAGVTASVWAGLVSDKNGGRLPMLCGSAVALLACVLGALNHTSVMVILIVVVISQLGIAAAYTGIPKVIVDASPPSRTSEATGLMTVVRATSQAIGAQVLAVLLASARIFDASGKSFPDDRAYTLVWWFMAAAAACGVLASWLVAQPPRAGKAAGPVPNTVGGARDQAAE
ncbi:MAG TPA: MFS transporter [Phenylobacterium sp.]|nr:MFS transporter [Phenylobacterium sp.]